MDWIKSVIRKGGAFAAALLCWTQATPAAAQNGIERFPGQRYGMIVHLVPELTVNSSGAPVTDINALANAFDAQAFANDLADFKVEYVIFTAWHFRMKPLYPSAVATRYRGAGTSSNRDLIRDMIDAVKAKGIRVLLYTHPRDGHDLASASERTATGWGVGTGATNSDPNPSTFNFLKWNNFVLESYRELMDRYGNDIDGLFIDEGDSNGRSENVVDYVRLRATLKAYNPNLVLIQNNYGSNYTADFGVKEYFYQQEFSSSNGDDWPAYQQRSVSTLFSDNWWAARALGQNTPRFTPEALFRYTVLQAGINRTGGGVNWAAGPYANGGWETGVRTTLAAVGDYVQNAGASLRGTYPSTSFVAPDRARIRDLAWGVATKSADDGFEYVHVLRPPAGSVLTLPAPADGKVFTAAQLLSGTAVTLSQGANGVTLTLPASSQWSAVDTIIRLTVQSPRTSPNAPGSWVACGGEGATCTFDNVRTVAYGAGGTFRYSRFTGSTACSNGIFGDPVPGVAKSCYYLQSAGGTSPTGYSLCAEEEQICVVNGPATVSFGGDGRYATLRTSGDVNCRNDLFGDPAPGVRKSCYVKLDSAAPGGRPYVVRNRTNLRLLTGDCTSDGCPVTEKAAGASGQSWDIQSTGYDFSTVRNLLDERVLNGGGGYEGYPVTKWSPVPSVNLQWRVVRKDNGSFKIVNLADGHVLNGGGGQEGYQVSEWTDVASTNLEWTIE